MKKIRICANCHFIVHHPPTEPKDFESLPKRLKELIKANIERKTEQEKTLGCSLDSNEIIFEMQKERLVLMKLINRHWILKNTKAFNETYPPLEPLICSSPEPYPDFNRKQEKLFDSKNLEREKLKEKFLIPIQKGENKKRRVI